MPNGSTLPMLRGLREAPIPRRDPCAAERRPRTAERRPLCRREEAPVPRAGPLGSVPEGILC